jgi:hypothetical protein
MVKLGLSAIKNIKEGVNILLGIESVVLNSYPDRGNRRVLEVGDLEEKLGQRKERREICQAIL